MEQICAQVLTLDLLFLHVSLNHPQIGDTNHTHTQTISLLQKGHKALPVFCFILHHASLPHSLLTPSLSPSLSLSAPVAHKLVALTS